MVQFKSLGDTMFLAKNMVFQVSWTLGRHHTIGMETYYVFLSFFCCFFTLEYMANSWVEW